MAVAIAMSVGLRLGSAQAAPLGSWCVGLERLFGASWSTRSFEREYEGWSDSRRTTFSLLGSGAPKGGFSSPRLGVDYVSESGLSGGAAVGVDAMARDSSYAGSDDDPNAVAFLLAPRLGYFVQPLPWLGVWPRLGVTYLGRTRGDDQLALSLDMPISFLVADERVGLMLVPYLDAVFPEDRKKAAEHGVLASVGMFF